MTALPEFDAVLWDMDGTLVLSETLIKKSVQLYQDKIGFPVSDDLYYRANGVSYQHAYNVVKQELGMNVEFDEWLQQSVNSYIELAPLVEHRHETAKIVRSLYQRGIKQAVISNSPRNIVEANVKGFLRDFNEPNDIFATVISADDLKTLKPDPEGYLLATKRLGVAPERCLVIEDSPTGVKAGKAAGCFTIYWPDDQIKKPLTVQPDLQTDDLSQLFV